MYLIKELRDIMVPLPTYSSEGNIKEMLYPIAEVNSIGEPHLHRVQHYSQPSYRQVVPYSEAQL